MPDIFNRVHTLFTNKDSTGLLRNENLGDLYFGQLHPLHQDLFDNLYGQHTRIRLKDLPHYTFWRDEEHKNIEKSLYYKYLSESWKFYYPNDNTRTKRLDKIERYIKLKEDIEKDGILKPIRIVTTPDSQQVIIDGNHRASIAYFLGIDVPYIQNTLSTVLSNIVHNTKEFYGTRNKDIPCQSIFYKETELLAGRRRDVYERILKTNIVEDIRGKNVADLGANISINAMLAWNFGAKNVTAIESSPQIATSALRLSTILNSNISLEVRDLGLPIKNIPVFNTVFCNSLYTHISNKKILSQNIQNPTKKVLYFEGHQRTTKDDYSEVFQYFKTVQLIGYNADGIHSKESTRPFFRCEK